MTKKFFKKTHGLRTLEFTNFAFSSKLDLKKLHEKKYRLFSLANESSSYISTQSLELNNELIPSLVSNLSSKDTKDDLNSFQKSKPMEFAGYSKIHELKLVTIEIASADTIKEWAEKVLPNGKTFGEVTNANTLHYKTFKPYKGGLFCERIFGPLKDFECACGIRRKPSDEDSKKILEHKQTKRYFCENCDVEYTWSVIRRYQLGYIKLAAPIVHLWYFKANPSYLSILLDIKRKDLDSFIYCIETMTLENYWRPLQNLDINLNPTLLTQLFKQLSGEFEQTQSKTINFLSNPIVSRSRSVQQSRSIVAVDKRKLVDRRVSIKPSRFSNSAIFKETKVTTSANSQFTASSLEKKALFSDISKFLRKTKLQKSNKKLLTATSTNKFSNLNVETRVFSNGKAFAPHVLKYFYKKAYKLASQRSLKILSKLEQRNKFTSNPVSLSSFKRTQIRTLMTIKHTYLNSRETSLQTNLFVNFGLNSFSIFQYYFQIHLLWFIQNEFHFVYNPNLKSMNFELLKKEIFLSDFYNNIQILNFKTTFQNKLEEISLKLVKKHLVKKMSSNKTHAENFSTNDYCDLNQVKKFAKSNSSYLSSLNHSKKQFQRVEIFEKIINRFIQKSELLLEILVTELTEKLLKKRWALKSLTTSYLANKGIAPKITILSENQILLTTPLYSSELSFQTPTLQTENSQTDKEDLVLNRKYSQSIKIDYSTFTTLKKTYQIMKILKNMEKNNGFQTSRELMQKQFLNNSQETMLFDGFSPTAPFSELNTNQLRLNSVTIPESEVSMRLDSAKNNNLAISHRFKHDSLQILIRNRFKQLKMNSNKPMATPLIKENKSIFNNRSVLNFTKFENRSSLKNAKKDLNRNTIIKNKTFNSILNNKKMLFLNSLKKQKLNPLCSNLQTSRQFNNLYTISHKHGWEIERDWRYFIYYNSTQLSFSDLKIPCYKHRTLDLLDPSSQVSITGTKILQNLLQEYQPSELQKMSKQHQILLPKLNRYIRKIRETASKNSELRQIRILLQKRDQIIRRLKFIRKLFRKNSNPSPMILDILPVLPPDLRPILKLQNQIAASDINRHYQRIIYRNDRVKKFLSDPATSQSFEMKYSQRLLQEAVDNLIQNGKGTVKPETNSRGQPLKSLSEILKGKQGRFRQYLLGKRVDYSGRSVIVVGPKLKLSECGLPFEMAVELFLPFLIKRIIHHKLTNTVIGAKNLMKSNPKMTWNLLGEIMKNHPVLLNRAPTLHRLGFQAFKPKLVDGRAILLHPLVCPAFNADFDGDQMAVHVPITVEARTEAWKLMFSRNNLISPATGEPLVLPSQDMVLGCYYLTLENIKALNIMKQSISFYFSDLDQVMKAYHLKQIHTHTPIWIKWNGVVEMGSDQAMIHSGVLVSKEPFEIRLNQNGNWDEIRAKSHRRFDKNGFLLNQYICTTAGRVLFNLMVKKCLQ